MTNDAHGARYAAPHGRRRRAAAAATFGAVLGLVAGGLVGGSLRGRSGAILGAVAGGTAEAAAEGYTDWAREPGTVKPAAHRVAVAVFVSSALGAAVELLGGRRRQLRLGSLFGAVVGTVGFVGLLSFRANRIGLGVASGIAVGAAGATLHAPLALVAGGVTLVYRLVGAVVVRGEGQVEVVGERVAPDKASFVVPFEAQTRRVGVGYFEDLARTRSGTFGRDHADIGIIDSMEALRGPTFDPDAVDPLVREFYEHTARFKLTIVPVWRRRIRPAFWLFKYLIARPMQQANLPFNTAEAQRGVVSSIETVSFGGEGLTDVRGWVRSYEASGDAIYVGIYTTTRHHDRGYVSVGFPLPRANFTATFEPFNAAGGRFLLKSEGAGAFPGHYISAIEADSSLTVIKVPSFAETIEVYVEDSRLKTDHRFFLAGLNFLTLNYSMDRL